MKNPLIKRIPRELKKDFTKYLVIFLFMIMLISLVSSFLVADISVKKSYDDGFEKYNLEWGHITFNDELPVEVKSQIEEKNNIKLYDLAFFEETAKETGGLIRVYRSQDTVNKPCIMEGSLPLKDDEIALDRLYAKNNSISIGDKITINNHALTVSGFIALPNYSCLFQNNSDMMFDAINFSIGLMSADGYTKVNSSHQKYNYAWMYNIAPTNDVIEKEKSDSVIDSLKDIITEYDEEVVEKEIEIQTEQYKKDYEEAYISAMSQGSEFSFPTPEEYIKIDENSLLSVKDYLPRYLNKAINFTGEDMDSDKAFFLAFNYIVIVILSFVFGVTITNTINQEAGVIGTLRASGYSKGELLGHYLVLPLIVSFAAAVIGNILGYTVMLKYMINIYYSNYSLATYVTIWSPEAFILTTAIPLILMFVINLVILIYKLRLSPLRFIRHDLSRKSKKKALRLNTKIPFMTRFRLRIILQNLPNYITLFVGIIFAALIVVFGLMFIPLLNDYSKLIEDSKICDYQYVLKSQVETSDNDAEKYCVTGLKTLPGSNMEDEITIYGILEDSKYIHATIAQSNNTDEAPGVYVSNGIIDKFNLDIGDIITYKDTYSDAKYDFKIIGEYQYDAALSVFMNSEDFKDMFEKSEDYFSGYLTNRKLIDVADNDVASIIDSGTLAKVSNQLLDSMASFVSLFKAFGIAMFLLLMYLLSKQVIEKNSQSISMTKILGFHDMEIGSLYVISTSFVVIASLLISIPVVDLLLRLIFKFYLYKVITGYIPFIISNSIYYQMVLYGILSYIVVSATQLIKISKIPKSDALKTVEYNKNLPRH